MVYKLTIKSLQTGIKTGELTPETRKQEFTLLANITLFIDVVYIIIELLLAFFSKILASLGEGVEADGMQL